MHTITLLPLFTSEWITRWPLNEYICPLAYRRQHDSCGAVLQTVILSRMTYP